MDQKYEQYKEAEKTGLCPLCGWKDGQGVKECYSDPEVGPLLHQNSMDAYRRSLSPSQLSLDDSYNSIRPGVWKDEDVERMRQHLLGLVEEDNEGFGAPNWRIGCCLYSKKRNLTREDAVEAWLADKSGLGASLAQGCTIRSIESYELGEHTLWPGFTCEQFALQKPHDCGGFAYFSGAYHIRCNRCNCEIKMWEHGVDFDVG